MPEFQCRWDAFVISPRFVVQDVCLVGRNAWSIDLIWRSFPTASDDRERQIVVMCISMVLPSACRASRRRRSLCLVACQLGSFLRPNSNAAAIAPWETLNDKIVGRLLLLAMPPTRMDAVFVCARALSPLLTANVRFRLVLRDLVFCHSQRLYVNTGIC